MTSAGGLPYTDWEEIDRCPDGRKVKGWMRQVGNHWEVVLEERSDYGEEGIGSGIRFVSTLYAQKPTYYKTCPKKEKLKDNLKKWLA